MPWRRPSPSPRMTAFSAARACSIAISGVGVQKQLRCGVQRLDPRQHRPRELDRREPAAPDVGRQVDRGAETEILVVHHYVLTSFVPPAAHPAGSVHRALSGATPTEVGAGVDHHDLAGHLARSFEEPDRHLGDFRVRAGRAERVVLGQALKGRLVSLRAEPCAHPLPLDEARAHRVDADVGRQHPGEGEGHGVERALGRGVGDGAPGPDDPRHRGDVDDRPPLHDRRRRPAHLVGADHVHRVDRVEVLGRLAFEVRLVAESRGAGVVDEPVEAPPLVHGRRDEAAAVGVVRDVRPDRDRPRAEPPALLRDRRRRALGARVVDDDVAALRGEEPGAGRPDPARRAGHDDGCPLEVHATTAFRGPFAASRKRIERRIRGRGVLGPLLAEGLHALPAAARLLGREHPKRREVPVALVARGERIRIRSRSPKPEPEPGPHPIPLRPSPRREAPAP